MNTLLQKQDTATNTTQKVVEKTVEQAQQQTTRQESIWASKSLLNVTVTGNAKKTAQNAENTALKTWAQMAAKADTQNSS